MTVSTGKFQVCIFLHLWVRNMLRDVLDPRHKNRISKCVDRLWQYHANDSSHFGEFWTDMTISTAEYFLWQLPLRCTFNWYDNLHCNVFSMTASTAVYFELKWKFPLQGILYDSFHCGVCLTELTISTAVYFLWQFPLLCILKWHDSFHCNVFTMTVSTAVYFELTWHFPMRVFLTDMTVSTAVYFLWQFPLQCIFNWHDSFHCVYFS